MKRFLWLALPLMLLACQPQSSAATIHILDGENLISLQTDSRIPAEIIAKAEIALAPADRVLVNGQVVDAATPMDCGKCAIQIRRVTTLTLVTPDGEQTIQTAAFTVGEALEEMGIQLYAADFLDPPAGTPVTDKMKIDYRPARELSVSVDGQIVQIRSSAGTVGAALSGSGIPLVGLDASQPSEFDPLPVDGQIRIIRIIETVELIQKMIPFSTEYVASNEVEIDQQEILQPGETGLTMSRVRVRYEDGKEVSRESEEERTVRQPTNQIVGYGTKYAIRTANVGGATIEYWRAIQVYATSYSPCNSGADRCYPSTASGVPVQKGVIGVIRSWYNAMQGQAVYVEGYGFATIEDIGAGIEGKDWIDLGYTDADYQVWHHWVTLYFLTPAPANTMWVLE